MDETLNIQYLIGWVFLICNIVVCILHLCLMAQTSKAQNSALGVLRDYKAWTDQREEEKRLKLNKMAEAYDLKPRFDDTKGG